ncbi:MAG: trehalose-phosphatase [Proteobacteria bacterium]|nr:trehalose-phosphatase [Pseudomonadota bacterium]
MTPPDLDRKTALFLDLDGTLLEIAATPEQVVVPPGLPALLAQLHHQLGGALAIVTGRPLTQIDELLRPFVSTAAGEHGVSLRYADGTREELRGEMAMPAVWREALQAAARQWPGVLVERKPHGLAVHYRLAPERADEVWRLVRELVPPEHPWFRLVPAHEAVEIGLRTASKGDAVERLMAHAPFHGRRPIFIGDDFTDEAGMTKARELGGVGLRVAEAFGGDPANVRAWLMQGAQRLDDRLPSSKMSSGAMP